MLKWQHINMSGLVVLDLLIRRRNTKVVAEELGISQSAVSQSLTRMRQLCDDVLFTRGSRGLIPTEYTLAIAGPVAKILTDFEALNTEFSPFNAEWATQTFTINIPPPAFSFIGPHLVREFRAQAPNCRLRTVYLDGSELEYKLELGEIDLALDGRLGTNRSIKRKRVSTTKIIIIGHRTRFPTGTISLDEINSAPHIAWLASRLQMADLNSEASAMNIRPNASIVTSDISAIPALIEMNPEFVAFVPDFTFQSTVSFPNLFELAPVFPHPPKFDGYMYWHASKSKRASLIWLRKIVEKSVARAVEDFEKPYPLINECLARDGL